MSIFRMFIMASNARLAAARSGSLTAAVSARGVICQDMPKTLDYLIKGQSFGGAYVLRNMAGYPGFKGLMTWSINWDKFTRFEFSNSHRAFLDTYP